MDSSYEGLQEDVRNLKTPDIETWSNQYADRDYLIRMDFPELTCICPKTGLPDFADVHIEYTPDEQCLELKSLKLYFVSFRDVGIFHEHLVNRILDDLVKACSPRYMRIEIAMNPRGGIHTTVEAEYFKES